MTTSSKFVYFAAIAASAILCGCSQPPAPPQAVVKPDTSNAITNIRAAGNQFDSSVEVHPLRDPAVDGLLDQSRKLEAQQQAAQALDPVARALKIAPNSPDVLQYQAELFVEMGDWKRAVDSAQRSYDLGPKVGALCARNLQTLIEAGNAVSDANAVAVAKQKLLGCRVPAPNRF
ncbi:MAG TPA: tetratricopeptide repeat protein [Rudaea sp.]|jgi:tetratricopeptide (TPR) repeat protein|nr:tetratricopeptide repeat protein [Rudaea sp.]